MCVSQWCISNMLAHLYIAIVSAPHGRTTVQYNRVAEHFNTTKPFRARVSEFETLTDHAEKLCATVVYGTLTPSLPCPNQICQES